MYLTRRLLRSTMEETPAGGGGVKANEEPVIKAEAAANELAPGVEDAAVESGKPASSPRKRRPLLQTRKASPKAKKIKPPTTPTAPVSGGTRESGGSQKGNAGAGGTGPARGIGLVIDARDSRERWCEAKVLKLDPVGRRLYIHYVGWNSRYDCWLPVASVAAHGSQTGVPTKPELSWDGKMPFFGPSGGAKKKKSSAPRKRRPEPVKAEIKDEDPIKAEPVAATGPDRKRSRTSASRSSTSSAAKTTSKVHVDVGTVDEESERRSRRHRKEKIDLELEMDVGGEAEEAASTGASTSAVGDTTLSGRNKTRPSPRVKTTVSPRTTKKSPRELRTDVKGEQDKAKKKGNNSSGTDQTKGGITQPTVDVVPAGTATATTGAATTPMSAVLRRSTRARTSSKKRAKTEAESDEDYVDDPKEVEEEEEEEDDGAEDELDESDVEHLRQPSVTSSQAKPKRVAPSRPSASRTPVFASDVVPWQLDEALQPTREKLAAIFRQRMEQRAQGISVFPTSYQHPTLGAAAPPGRVAQEKPKPARSRNNKKAKTAAAPDEGDEVAEAEAAAAAYYYTHPAAYYHMQAYQYHQYYYQQAMLAAYQQQQQQVEGSDEDKDKGEGEEEEGKDSETNPDELQAEQNHRLLQARMDAIEEQRRWNLQQYYQLAAQARERNLQLQAMGHEFLEHSEHLWKDQTMNGHQPASEHERPRSETTSPSRSHDGTATESADGPETKSGDDNGLVAATTSMAGEASTKVTEARAPDGATSVGDDDGSPQVGAGDENPPSSAPSTATSAHSTPVVTESAVTNTDESSEPATASPSKATPPQQAQTLAVEACRPEPKGRPEGILYEFVL